MKYRNLFPYLAVALFGLILAFKVIYPYDPSIYGDAPAHFYKVQILAEQVKNENMLLWGSYDWSWYCGYPFLMVYPPLFYFLVLPIKLVFNLSSTSLAIFTYCLLYPLTALSVYALAYEVTKDKLAAIAGVLAYGCLPFVFTVSTVEGTVPRMLALSFIPLFILLTEKLTNRPKLSVNYFILAILLLSIIQLAHTTIFFNLVALTVLLMILKYVFVRKFDLRTFLILPISFILSSWTLLPNIYYTSTYAIFTSRVYAYSIQKSLYYFIQYFIIEIGIMGSILIALSFITYRMLSRKNRHHLTYLLCFIIPTSLLWSIGLILHAKIPGLRTLVAHPFIVPTYSIFTIPILSSYIALNISKERKEFLALSIFREKRTHQFRIDKGKTLILITCSLLLLTSYIYNPPRYFRSLTPSVRATYQNAFEYVGYDSKFTKVPSFSEYFNESLSNWEEFGGSWSLVNERCIGEEWHYMRSYLMHKNNLTDFVYETSFKWTAGIPYSGIAFRFQNQNNTYVLRWVEKWKVVKLEKCVNGTWSSLASYGNSTQIDRDTWHTLGIEVNGNRIRAYLDQKEVISTIDETFSYGRIGLTVYNSCVEFDNLKVYLLEMGGTWFRDLFIATGSWRATSPLYTQQPTLDGYYPIGCRNEITLGTKLICEKLSSLNVDEGLRIAKLFNVKYMYIVPDIWYYNYSQLPEVGQQVLEELLNSTLADFFYQKDFIYIFKLNESYPMIASTNVFVITEGNEVSEFYKIVSNEFFHPSLGVFLSKDNDLKGIAWTPWLSNVTRDNGHVNLRVNNIEEKSTSMKFNVTVDCSCFLSLPISHYPFLRVEVDGHPTEALKSLPAFISLKVSSGTHNITVYRVRSKLEDLSLSITIGTLLTLLCLIVLPQIFKKRSQFLEQVR